MKYCLNSGFSCVIAFHRIPGNSFHECLLARVSKPHFLKCESCSIMFMQQRGSGRGTILVLSLNRILETGADLFGPVDKQVPVWQCELHLILVVTCRPSHPLRVLCAWFQDASRKKLAHGVFLDKISGNSNKDEKMRGNEMVTVNMGSVVASHVSVVEVLCSHVLTLRELAAQN